MKWLYELHFRLERLWQRIGGKNIFYRTAKLKKGLRRKLWKNFRSSGDSGSAGADMGGG